MKLYNSHVFQYVELYIVPGTFDEYISIWKRFSAPFVIHAPHFEEGLNLAKREKKNSNILLMEEALRFSDILKSDSIIIHPGVDGDLQETIAQLNIIDDERVIIENKPYRALFKGLICNGNSPEEIGELIHRTGVKLCLDIGHAICSANSHEINPYKFIDSFLNLNPIMIHLTDGEYQSEFDHHFHLGEGDFPLKSILAKFAREYYITLETKKDRKNDLIDFEKDVIFFRNLEKSLQ